MLMEFERESCSRCGGSGHYSYCEMHGTTCFKCGGSGKQYTKRGHAALTWMRDQQTTRLDAVAPGDYVDTGGGQRFVVDRIYQDRTSCARSLQPDGSWKEHDPFIHLCPREGSKAVGLQGDPATKVRLIGKGATWKEDRRAWLLKAFAYQDTLTKAGTPAKRRTA